MRWQTCVGKKYKNTLLKTMYIRTFRLVSGNFLDDEIVKFRDIFQNSGFPPKTIAKVFQETRRKLVHPDNIQFAKTKEILFRIPYFGQQSQNYMDKIEKFVSKFGCGSMKVRSFSEEAEHYWVCSLKLIRNTIRKKIPASIGANAGIAQNVILETPDEP